MRSVINKPKNISDDEFEFSLKATVKVDVSEMAHRLRIFYARKEMCKTCIENGAECPYNYDPIACIYGGDSIN